MTLGAGQIVTEDDISQLALPVYTKAIATDRVNNTLSDDPELLGIPLAVGTYHIELLLFFTTALSTIPKLKTTWAFTGTWNNPQRHCTGPGSAQTATRTDMTEITMMGTAAASSAVYSAAASTGFNAVREVVLEAVVTVAGNLSLSWAQSVTNANATSVKPGTGFVIHRWAD